MAVTAYLSNSCPAQCSVIAPSTSRAATGGPGGMRNATSLFAASRASVWVSGFQNSSNKRLSRPKPEALVLCFACCEPRLDEGRDPLDHMRRILVYIHIFLLVNLARHPLFFLSFGGISQTTALMLLETRSTEYDEWLCTSTSAREFAKASALLPLFRGISQTTASMLLETRSTEYDEFL